MSDNTQQTTTGKQFAAVERPKNRKIFSGFGGGVGRALPRPQRGGGGGNMLRLIAMAAAVVIVLGNSTSTEITAQLVSSALLWGAVGYVITWVAQYAFDASWEGNWGLFIARVTMPLIALVVFSTIGLSIATRAASRIATVTATAPPVQSASQLAGGLVRILGGVTQSAAATAASWGGEASWGEYASGVQTMTVGGIVEGLVVSGGNGGPYAAAGMNPPAVAAVAAAAPETQVTNPGAVAFNGPWNVAAYDDDAPPAFTGPWAPEYYQGQGASGDQTVSERPGEYVVARGDNLSRIAKHVYGDGDLWTLICAANASTLRGNCSALRVGMRLVIPDRATAPQTMPAQVQPNAGVRNAATGQTQPVAQPTAVPLVLMAAQSGAQPTAVPLVLMAAQDQPVAQPTAVPLVLMAAQN